MELTSYFNLEILNIVNNSSPKRLLLLLLILLFIGVIAALLLFRSSSQNIVNTIAYPTPTINQCGNDARVCPFSGKVVEKSGPKCEFSDCTYLSGDSELAWTVKASENPNNRVYINTKNNFRFEAPRNWQFYAISLEPDEGIYGSSLFVQYSPEYECHSEGWSTNEICSGSEISLHLRQAYEFTDVEDWFYSEESSADFNMLENTEPLDLLIGGVKAIEVREDFEEGYTETVYYLLKNGFVYVLNVSGDDIKDGPVNYQPVVATLLSTFNFID